MVEQNAHMKKCLLIGGKADGRRITFDTREKIAHVMPRMQFILPRDEPVNEPTPDPSETYVRATLHSPSREYHVYLHESLPEEALIEALIGGYRIEGDKERR
jgi:hypothetical protein